MTKRGRGIVTVAVGQPFESYVPAFLAGATKYGHADYVRALTAWPPGSPTHQEHHYAFKWFALEALRVAGARRVLWLDSQVKIVQTLETLWMVLERDGHVLCDDGAPLEKWISDKALAYFDLRRTSATVTGQRVMAGTVIGLDLENRGARDFYEEWGRLAAEKHGLFMSSHSKASPGRMRSLPVAYGSDEPISTDPNVLGHRSDEACLTLMAGARRMGVNFQIGRELLTDWVPDTTEKLFSRLQGTSRTIDNNRIVGSITRRVAIDGSVTVPQLLKAMEERGITQFDYVCVFDNHNAILREWPGQIARQISCGEMPDDETLAHLGKWYDVVHAAPGDVLLHSRGRHQ